MKSRRLPAEWELQSAVQLTFPHAGTDWADILEEVVPCFVEIIETISRFELVLVVCQDPEEVRPLLNGVQPGRLILVAAGSNDSWARDHGGITVLEGNRPFICDFVFNGWGLKFAADKDNLITGKLFEKNIFNVDGIVLPGLVLEGGSIESDGRGTLLTTAQCLLSPNRNAHLSREQIENRLGELFGLDRILWLHHGYLAGDDTDAHIDTLARFCDENTIAYVQCTDPADEHYTALRNMETELQGLCTLTGVSYTLLPLPLPAAIYDDSGQRLPATYANFLIINDAVLLPVYGVAEDVVALERLRPAFPGREIIPINCRALIKQHGSLHCITMQYPAGVIKDPKMQRL